MSDADKIRNSGTQQCIIVVKISGFLGSMFSGLQFLSSPLLGALSDVCGRKPIIILSVAGTLVSYLVSSTINVILNYSRKFGYKVLIT